MSSETVCPNQCMKKMLGSLKKHYLTNLVTIDHQVYNGTHKINSGNKNFIEFVNVINVTKSLKSKNSQGYDRIPQKVLFEGVDVLAAPMYKLLLLVYKEKKVLKQWLISKTIPIFKNKGQIREIENYKPIAIRSKN
jgi:hypothetical protein